MSTEQRAEKVLNVAWVNLGRVVGAVGVVLLVSLPLTWILTEELGALVMGKGALGIVGILVYATTNQQLFKRLMGARSTGLMIMSVISAVVVLGIVVAVNYVAFKNPKEWDMTREGIYTLSPQTESVLGRLNTDVQMYAFYPNTDPMHVVAKDTLERYAANSPHLSYELVDPAQRPDLVEKFKITERSARIVLTGRDQESRAKNLSEQELTNGIIKVAEKTSKTIYFLSGHGEIDLAEEQEAEGASYLADAIRAEGYQVADVSLINPDKPAPSSRLSLMAESAAATPVALPHNVTYLVVAGVRSALLEPEIAAIEAFLKNGGRLIVLLDPATPSGLADLLARWRIEVHDDLVVDPNPLMGLGPAAPIVTPTENAHPSTRGVNAAVMMTVRSLGIGARGEPGVDTVPLLQAGQSTWGETNLLAGEAEQDDRDHYDVKVAMVATKSTAQLDANKLSEEARVVVFGDSDWVTNKFFSVQGNSDLILNTLNWLAEEEARITIRPRSRTASKLSIYGENLSYLKFLSMDILPVFLVAMGLGIVLIRRQR